MIVFSSERKFNLYTYLPGHGLLLLRSMSQQTPKRVDVLFQDVRSIDIKVWLTGISVSECCLDEVDNSGELADLIEPGIKIFRIQSQSWSGLIVAGGLRVGEDNGRWVECSMLLSKDSWDTPFGPIT
jgi:hypothetical protein